MHVEQHCIDSIGDTFWTAAAPLRTASTIPVMAMLERSASRQESCAFKEDALCSKRVVICIATIVGRGGVLG